MIENSSTIKDLAIYLARQVPPTEQILAHSTNELKSDENKVVPQLKASSTASQNAALLPENISDRLTDNTAIKRLMAQQLQVMSKQLDARRYFTKEKVVSSIGSKTTCTRTWGREWRNSNPKSKI